MSDEAGCWIVSFIAIAFAMLLVFAGFEFGKASGRVEMQREAVSRGYATYSPDEKGDPVWQWKEVKGE